jgi:hypothetical protein
MVNPPSRFTDFDTPPSLKFRIPEWRPAAALKDSWGSLGGFPRKTCFSWKAPKAFKALFV